MNLHEQVDDINSREDFASFVRALIQDIRQDPDSWENNTVESFLDGIAAWVVDLDGYYANRGEAVPEQPNWKVFGQILLAAKLYE
jgi:hypothetical protein